MLFTVIHACEQPIWRSTCNFVHYTVPTLDPRHHMFFINSQKITVNFSWHFTLGNYITPCTSMFVNWFMVVVMILVTSHTHAQYIKTVLVVTKSIAFALFTAFFFFLINKFWSIYAFLSLTFGHFFIFINIYVSLCTLGDLARKHEYLPKFILTLRFFVVRLKRTRLKLRPLKKAAAKVQTTFDFHALFSWIF